MRPTQYTRRILLHEIRATNNEIRATNNEMRTTRDASRLTFHASQNSGGFTLLPLIGILAIMTIVAAAIGPNLIARNNQTAQDAESQHLEEIHKGLNTYLRRNLNWPSTLSSLSPDYSTVSGTQLTQNDRGYPRYYAVHPTMSGFANATGIDAEDVEDAKVLVISDTNADAAPTITNAAQFDNWWETAETENLHIQKGHMGSSFHEVTLSATGTGGSYQIDGVATSSSGGTLADHTRHHLQGTVIGLDEANTYGTPELQFALTESVSYTYVPCLTVGQRWQIPPVPSCTSIALWVSTSGNTSGTSGITWGDSEIVAFGDPNLAYDTGPTNQTAGTFAGIMDLKDFTSIVDVDAGHYVSRALTIGGGFLGSINLEVGDILLSVDATETLSSENDLTVDDEDVFVFRPTLLGDYSAGSFFLLIDGSDVFNSGDSDLQMGDVQAMTLVEVATTVAGTDLLAGDFLVAGESVNVVLFRPTSLGTTTSGTRSLFIEGNDIRMDGTIDGLELIENTIEIGDITLQSGQILASVTPSDFDLGDNGITAYQTNIFTLDLTSVGSNTEGDATIIFDGFDVGLNTPSENVDLIALTGAGSTQNTVALSITNPDFETGDISGWTKTGDLLDAGGLNQWGAVTSAGAMSSPYEGSYFAGGRATGAIGSGEHITGIYQRIDVSAYSTAIDLGTATVNFAGYGHGENSADFAFLRIAYYDAVSGGNQLGSNVNSNEATQSETWTSLTIAGDSVPTGTRSIELLFLGNKVTSGSYLDVGFDDVSATLTYP